MYHGCIGSRFRWSCAITEVSSDKSQCLVDLVGIVDRVLNLFSPGEVFADGDAQVFTAVYHLQRMSMNVVVGVGYMSSIGRNLNDSTLSRVKLHLPVFLLISLAEGQSSLELMCL